MSLRNFFVDQELTVKSLAGTFLPVVTTNPTTMEVIISSYQQPLSTPLDVPIEKEHDVGLDLDALTEATESEMTEGDIASQISSSQNGDDEHEHFFSSSLEHLYNGTSPVCSRESLLDRTVSILKRSVSADDVQFIKATKRCWNCLPRPDLDEIVRRSNFALELQTQSITLASKSKSVRFGNVAIRHYSQTLGDNPSCSYGPPVQLDWDFEENDPLSVDNYEDKRAPRRSPRQMVLSFYLRKNLLMFYYGVSEDEIKVCKRQIKREKLHRSLTASSLVLMPVEAAWESAARKFKRVMSKKSLTVK